MEDSEENKDQQQAENETEPVREKSSAREKSSNLVSVTNTHKLIKFRDLGVTLPPNQTVEITKEQAKAIKEKPLFKHVSSFLKFTK